MLCVFHLKYLTIEKNKVKRAPRKSKIHTPPAAAATTTGYNRTAMAGHGTASAEDRITAHHVREAAGEGEREEESSRQGEGMLPGSPAADKTR